MITLDDDHLTFGFPEVHEEARCRIDFQRTLRIPDDGKDYPLPPGLGTFPLRHIDDFAQNLPEAWLKRGGVIMPMHQAEAMWVHFGRRWDGEAYPFAVKIATGKINVVTGEAWTHGLNADPQDYVVIPKQPWVDGYCVKKGVIRQFVAAPLGLGYTVEEQVAGEAEHGGLQIVVYPMKAERYAALRRPRVDVMQEAFACMRSSAPAQMGLAPGGRMRQKIYDDPYGLDAWDQRHSSRCFVTIANAEAWRGITGRRPPTAPLTGADYSKAGLPWFDYADGNAAALAGSPILGKLKSLFTLQTSKGTKILPENESATIGPIIPVGRSGETQVREMPS
jgi:hypothetical protein